MTSGANYVGFFGAVKYGAVVQNLTVDIRTNGTQFVGGIAGGTDQEVHIRNCEVYGTVSATGNFVGGVVGLLRHSGRSNGGELQGLCRRRDERRVGRRGGRLQPRDGHKLLCPADATVKGTAASELPLVGSSPNVGAITGENQTNGENIGTAAGCGLCDANGNPRHKGGRI